MRRKWKKMVGVAVIVLLLPYVLTILLNGSKINHNRNDLLESYCIGRLVREMPATYEEEARKAQAVLVRTSVYQEVERKGKKAIQKKDAMTMKDMQRMWGKKQCMKYYRCWKRAWEETDGQVLMYQGKLAFVPFHNMSNGKTRNAKEVLGTEEYPYLVSKECPKDHDAEDAKNSRLIPLEHAEVVSRDEAGYATEIKIGEEIWNGEKFRNKYGLLSSSVELKEYEGKIQAVTYGIGHGLGMSQYTANEMAKEGKKHEEILQYFFEGTELREVAEVLLDLE